jgi:hemerythrin-like domain-containing protein
MEYTLHYQDLCHHPKEELIFRKLVTRSPAWLAAVEVVRDEHRRLAEIVRRCAAAVHSVLLDAALPREWFECIVQEYISLLRHHMEEEERELFPRAMYCLTESDWREIDAAIHQPGGELSDDKLEHHYHQLQRRILQLAA